MISKKDILKIAKHIIRRDQGRVDRRLLHPTREWAVGVLGAAVLFVGSVAYAGYIFYFQLQQTDIPSPTEMNVVSYDAKKAQEVFKYYEVRRQKFLELQNAAPTINISLPPQEDLREDSEGEQEEEGTTAPTSTTPVIGG